MTTSPTSRASLAQHRALAVPSRADLLRALQEAGTPLTVQQLAAAVDLHVSTAREHLAVLVEVGLVERSVGHTGGRGRPHTLYEAASEADPAAHAWVQDLLTRVLLPGYGTAMADPGTAAERAAAALTAPTAAPDGRADATPRDRQLAALRSHFRRLGFAPELAPDGTEVVLRRCPVLDLARERQGVVCAVHLGLARGVLDQAEGPVTATGLTPFAGPGWCVLHLDPGADGAAEG